ncbi:MAG: beta-N-acetylhexosaminidase [Hyphomicrobiaceae bacterium]
MQRAFITGVSGLELTRDERAFVNETQPAGLILFARNCASQPQITALVADFKAAVGHDNLLVLIDQEGGRVQRLRPPLARLLPPAAAFMAHHDGDLPAACHAARLVARLTAEDLAGFAINTSCAPVLDVPVAGAHDIIGNRAYSRDPAVVIALGRAVAEGLMAGGILPVMKHIPGHGRAGADSHHELPTVTTSRDDLVRSDFAPFKALADLPAAMTAHVRYTALDAIEPASTSLAVTHDIMRGHIGFDGLLMSDDLSMQALTGTFTERTRRVLAAGSDLALHCNGDLAEMREVAAASPVLSGRASQRFARALAVAQAPRSAFNLAEAEAATARLLAPIA